MPKHVMKLGKVLGRSASEKRIIEKSKTFEKVHVLIPSPFLSVAMRFWCFLVGRILEFNI